MGLLKRRMEEQQHHGFRLDRHGGSVCDECVNDYALAAVVRDHAVDNHCDFCGRDGNEPIACYVDHILAHMGDSFAADHDLALEVLFVDDGEFVGPHYDIEDVLIEADWEGHPAFRALVMEAFGENIYAPSSLYARTEFEALKTSWEVFKYTVIHTARFTFALHDHVDDGEAGHPVLWGGAMLERLGELLAADCVTELPAGTRWYRARSVEKGKPDYTTAKDLGAPPSDKAAQNRMSPGGIPMFYGGDNPDTVIAEALGALHDVKGIDVMLSAFETTIAAPVVDLTALPPVPSVFDAQLRDTRDVRAFLDGFADDVSSPVSIDDRLHVEYVPTQVVGEYIRHLFRTQDGKPAVGLMYRSAKNPKAKPGSTDGVGRIRPGQNEE